MAESRNLNIILELQDRASEQLKGFRSKLESMRPAFQKMALGGTVAFAGISAGIGKAVNEARKAEDIQSLFNLAFGDIREDAEKTAMAFSDEFGRSESRIKDSLARVAFQFEASTDLSRQKMLELSNSMLPAAEGLALLDTKVESGTDVMQAFSDALSGQNQMLGRMIGGYEEAEIKAKALNEGIIEQGEELDNTSRALALHKLFMDRTTASQQKMQEENRGTTDKLRQFKDTMKDLVEKAGKPFLDQLANILDKITPVLKKVQEWVEENPKLVKNILLASAALAGLVAVAGFLGLAMLAINPAMLALSAVLAIIGAVVYWVISNWEELKASLEKSGILDTLKTVFSTLKDAIVRLGKQLIDRLKPAWEQIKRAIKPILPELKFVAKVIGGLLVGSIFLLVEVLGFMLKFWVNIFTTIITIVAGWFTFVKGIFQALIGLIKGIVTGDFEMFKNGVKNMLEGAKTFLNGFLNFWKRFWNNVKDFVLNTWNNVSNLLVGNSIIPDMISAIKAAFLRFFTRVRIIFNKVKNFFITVWQKIKTFVTDTIAKLSKKIQLTLAKMKAAVKKALDKIKNTWNTIWSSIKKFFDNLWDNIKDKATSVMEDVKNAIQPVIDMIDRIISGIQRIGGSVGSTISNAFSGGGTSVDDAVINPRGEVITTNPNDFLIATKDPSQLGGKGLTVNINGGIFGSDAGEELGDQIMEQLKLRTNV